MNIYKDPFKDFPKHTKNELRGTEGMEVKLVDHTKNPYKNIFLSQKSSWRPWDTENVDVTEMIQLIKDMVDGKVWAGQAFEGISFTFAIKNISRACTHQLVRTRVGAGFMQESGREGTWDKAPIITPLTILENDEAHSSFIQEALKQQRLYKSYQKNGIPPQDARSVMGHFVAQNMWATYNFRALLETASKRLCTTMQWEINTLFRMMRDEVLRTFPHLGVLIRSACERQGGCRSITDYYRPGAENNGNKIYYKSEGKLCGKASNFSENEIKDMLARELKVLKLKG